MSTQIDCETDGCTFEWKIVNISHCLMKIGETLNSPVFIADTLDGAKYSVRLYPSGVTDDRYLCLYLHKEACINKPTAVKINFQLGFLNKDGAFLKEENGYLESSDNWSCQLSELRETIFNVERETYLYEDTLSVKCTMWKKEEIPLEPKHFFAQTIFKVNKKSFVWRIDKFSTIVPGVISMFKDDLIAFDIVINETVDCIKKLDMHITSFKDSLKYFSFKASIRNAEEKKTTEDIHVIEYIYPDIKENTLSTLFYTKRLMANKSRYFPNDNLVLDCEYVTSNGTYLQEVYTCGRISPKTANIDLNKNNNDCEKNPPLKEKPLDTSVIAKDIKYMYDEAILSDTELHASTQKFRAHMNILSARSPVFRNMFESDMKEKNNGLVNITDVEDDTVKQMLQYIYTDSLEDLQFESAYKLYMAADKYEILSLREICSSFLRRNLSPDNVCEVLVLVDHHKDDHLKKAVHEYILKHDHDVFGSMEWKRFMCTNIEIAADVMYRKVFPS